MSVVNKAIYPLLIFSHTHARVNTHTHTRAHTHTHPHPLTHTHTAIIITWMMWTTVPSTVTESSKNALFHCQLVIKKKNNPLSFLACCEGLGKCCVTFYVSYLLLGQVKQGCLSPGLSSLVQCLGVRPGRT